MLETVLSHLILTVLEVHLQSVSLRKVIVPLGWLYLVALETLMFLVLHRIKRVEAAKDFLCPSISSDYGVILPSNGFNVEHYK